MKPIRIIENIAIILLLLVLVQGALAAGSYAFVSTRATTAYRVGGSAVDSVGNVYITDKDNGQLIEYYASGGIRSWSGFASPGGVATDSQDNVYVLDEGHHEVTKLDKYGNVLTNWFPEGPASVFFLPGIAVGPGDRVYTIDSNQHIQVFESDGTYVTQWTNTVYDPAFQVPRYIAADQGGFVYVTMTENQKIFKFTTNGNYITSWDSSGSLDDKYAQPRGIAVDRMNNVFVANAQVPVFDSAGDLETTIFPSVWMAKSEYGPPSVGSVAAGLSGEVYLSGNYHIDKFQTGGSGITVTSDPPGAEIFIDGGDTGQATPATLATGPGDHYVTVTLSGYHTPNARRITVPSGSVAGVDFTLADASTVGTLHVTSSQNGAAIFINGQDSGKTTPAYIDLAPDMYDVYVTLAGYQTPASQSVTVAASSTTDVDFILGAIPATGTLHVTSSPDHAEIFVNSVDTGKTTPAYLDEPVGTYAVFVTLSGYETPAPQDVPVIAGQTTDADFPLTPSPTSGTIHVTSDPTGAEIFIEGKDTGMTTPASIEESPGSYSVEVTLSGYLTPQPQDIVVETGHVKEAAFLLVSQPKGTIHVTSSPIATEVFVNGADTGEKTPADIELLPGTYQVTVGGFDWYKKPAAKSVTVEAGETTNVDFSLQATGKVQVTVSFGGGKIFLDGYDTGTWAPGTLDEVVPGHHTITVNDLQQCGFWGSTGVDVTALTTTSVQVSMSGSCLPMYYVSSACPVDISVADPAGHIVSGLRNEIPGSLYLEYGPGNDGRPDSKILIPPSADPGNYLVTVTPKADALPADTFTLTLTDPHGKITVLADQVPVSEIPARPYSFTIPQNTSPVPEFPATSVPVLGMALFTCAVTALTFRKKL